MKALIKNWGCVIFIVLFCVVLVNAEFNSEELIVAFNSFVFKGKMIEASAYIFAFLKMAAFIFIVVFAMGYMTTLMYEISIKEALGKQLNRFFALPVMVIFGSCAGAVGTVNEYVAPPVFNWGAQFLWNEEAIFYIEYFSHAVSMFSISLISVSVMLNAYGKLSNINSYLNILWSVLCIPFAYALSFELTVNLKCAVWFVVVAIITVALFIVYILNYRRKNSTVLQNRYVVTTLDLNMLSEDMAKLIREDDTEPSVEEFRCFSDILEEMIEDDEDITLYEKTEQGCMDVLDPEKISREIREDITKQELYEEIGLDLPNEKEN